jgi:hypothetical protein
MLGAPPLVAISQSAISAKPATGDTLEIPGPEVLKPEQIAKKPSRAFGDDDHVWFGDTLQACCEVRRFTDDAALLRVPRSDQFAHDDQPQCRRELGGKGRIEPLTAAISSSPARTARSASS